MTSARLFLALAVLSAPVTGRVTFRHSEVLQETDLVANKAAFSCANGCRVYSDSQSANLVVTNAGTVLTTFKQMGGTVFPLLAPYLLPAGGTYQIENRGGGFPQFVFYVVDNKAPYLDTDVMTINDDFGIHGNSPTQRFTILSSRYASVRYSGISGDYLMKGSVLASYPRIYASGFDTVGDPDCTPLYRAKSYASMAATAVAVFSPISTVDFGAEGEHTAVAQWNKDSSITVAPNSSAVFMSPGYPGCDYNKNEFYTSPKTELSEKFAITAYSLDINGAISLAQLEDVVHLKVNSDDMSLLGFEAISKHYDAPNYNVQLTWTRHSPAAHFSLQFDFGVDIRTPIPEDVVSTTKSAPLIASLMALIAVLVRML